MQILSLTGQITRSTWEVPCPRLPKAQTRLVLNEKAHPQGIRWRKFPFRTKET